MGRERYFPLAEVCKTRQIYPCCYYKHCIKKLRSDYHSNFVMSKISDEKERNCSYFRKS